MKSTENLDVIQDLARFRYSLRTFLRFSENAARACGVTPQQHQLMLGVAGFSEGGKATISDLAEFLQERNNSVVGLVERAVKCGLVRREASESDRRQVIVSLTGRGKSVLFKLSRMHVEEVRRVRTGFLSGRNSTRRSSTNGSKAGHSTAPIGSNGEARRSTLREIEIAP